MVSPYASLSQRWNLDRGRIPPAVCRVRYLDHDIFAKNLRLRPGWCSRQDTEFQASYARRHQLSRYFLSTLSRPPQLGHSLHPETLDHYELGASSSSASSAKLDLTLFYDGRHDRIVLTYSAVSASLDEHQQFSD